MSKVKLHMLRAAAEQMLASTPELLITLSGMTPEKHADFTAARATLRTALNESA